MDTNNGKADPWSPINYKLHADFVPKLVKHDLITLLSPKSHERILDLGCGDGVLTYHIQSMCKECIGIDISQRMIEEAKLNECKDVRVVNCEKLVEWINNEGFIGYFDAVFSNAALHWMKNQEAVIEGIAKCLKPGGRFVAELGGSGNVQSKDFMVLYSINHVNHNHIKNYYFFLFKKKNIKVVEKSLIGALDKRGYNGKDLSPWYFPSPEDYTQILNNYKFSVSYLSHFPRPTELPTSLNGWVETFGFSFLAPLDNNEKEIVKDEVEEMCKNEAFNNETDKWTLDYVRLRVVAQLNV
ncbi:S-adenosyl-L-methionine-dependent methyltransferase [Glomus cerebriforme]|uniref:S-adenosyl-L-methionine-dependent methyltransferase n=1 Tax=Glomus cerebriforme TaxID=658196 RepID=A0A397TD71_9GLOM|nr:S-adenosyl-L-methionine-dependent methyltransferase [Glomus cerebriforme]